MSLFKLHKISLVALAVATSCYSATLLADDSKAKAEEDIEVITVKSKRGLISYVSASGAKSDTPIIETPLSVSVLTE